MFNTEDDWIRATTDPLDFCAECRNHLSKCECPDNPDDTMRTQPHCHLCGCDLHNGECPEGCNQSSNMADVDPCLYCGKAYPTFGLYPYCSTECSAKAEADV